MGRAVDTARERIVLDRSATPLELVGPSSAELPLLAIEVKVNGPDLSRLQRAL
jgi:hypothetical protein